MLSKNNKKLQAQKMEPKQQRFAIKKFTVGVASVLVGTTFALYSGVGSVSANETATQEATAEVVEDKADQTDDKEVTATNTADTEASTANTDAKEATPAVEEVTDQSAQTQANEAEKATDAVENEAEATTASDTAKDEATTVQSEEGVNAQAEKPVATSAFRAATYAAEADTATPGDPNTQVSAALQEELEKNAVYSPGTQGEKKTYAGRAWLQTTGTATDAFRDGSDIPMAGVKVYLQWVNGKGHVSKIYYTTSEADGTYVINLDHPDLEDGNEFKLSGDGKFAIRTWINNPDPEKYNIVKQGDGIYGFHTRLNRKNESWDFYSWDQPDRQFSSYFPR